MQIDRMRHYGRADDADRKQDRFAVGELRRHRVEGGRAPIDRRDEHFCQIANTDQADDRANDEFERTKAELLAHQQPVSDNRGRHHPGQERHV